MAMATADAMAEVTAGPKIIKEEEEDMDTAADGDATQLLAEGPDDGSANGGQGQGGTLDDRTCPICKKVSKSSITLRMHLRNVHVNAGSSYVCELCGVSYKLKASLEKHVRGVHQENRERDAICDICGFATFSNQELKMHRQRVHDKGPSINDVRIIFGFFDPLPLSTFSRNLPYWPPLLRPHFH